MSNSYRELFRHLTTQDVILTVNRRLATTLRYQHALYQQEVLGLTIWQPPDILPLTSWLERCWEECQIQGTDENPTTLLAPMQEQFIWEQIILNSAAGKELLCPISTVRMAQQAWQLTKQWQMDYTSYDFNQTEESQIWQTWAIHFQKHCQTHCFLDQHSLPDWLAHQISHDRLHLPKRIFMVGFDEISPQIQNLLNTLESKQIKITSFRSGHPHSTLRAISLIDGEQELNTMARWAHHHWQQGVTSIGCVIPNLSEIRNDVLATFNDLFTPEACLPNPRSETASPFNISAGNKLTDFPIIQTALAILHLQNSNKLLDLGVLLRSPYCGYAEQEMTVRALLDAELRSYGEVKCTLQELRTAAKRKGAKKLDQLLQNFLALAHPTSSLGSSPRTSGGEPEKSNAKHCAGERPSRDGWAGLLGEAGLHSLKGTGGGVKELLQGGLEPQHWATFFSQQLAAMGWPGERPLNSIEHQLLENWSNLLTQFAKQSLVCNTLTHSQALRHLQQFVNNQEFQAKMPFVPIQILGVLEATGFEFEQLWVMGLQDQTWPAAPKPNPFIPLNTQRKLGLPHSSSQRELAYCRVLTERLCRSAKQVILSYPHHLNDEHLRPSPVLQDIPLITPAELNLTDSKTYAEKIMDSALLESFTDDIAPRLTAIELEKITGGSAIFKEQSACPFRAFARCRLGARALNAPQTGLTAQERGSLMHKALETVWNLIREHHTLTQLSATELEEIIAHALDLALVNFIKKRPSVFQTRFTQIEKARLSHLLRDWLALEKQRSAFTIVSTEQVKHHTIAGIPLQLRIDRIDQLATGHTVIIDYKTGNPSINDWFGERPEEPQLPLYCIANEQPISGLLFAQIRSNNKQFRGIAIDERIDIEGVSTLAAQKNSEWPQNWHDCVHYWQAILTRLAQEFYEGQAQVDPKDGAKTCQFCDLQPFCRIKEKGSSLDR